MGITGGSGQGFILSKVRRDAQGWAITQLMTEGPIQEACDQGRCSRPCSLEIDPSIMLSAPP